MKYKKLQQATFEARPNRFLAECILPDGTAAVAHVKNTGRCKELLTPGAKVYLEPSASTARKTQWSLVMVYKELSAQMVNLDSQAPNKIAKEALESGSIVELSTFYEGVVRSEVKVGDSRLDLVAQKDDQKVYIEVKGVTLEENGVAMFPDAPTDRGLKHVTELIRLACKGENACLLFVVQMKGCYCFCPNWAAQPELGDAIKMARDSGVQILAYDCKVDAETGQVVLDKALPVVFEETEWKQLLSGRGKSEN